MILTADYAFRNAPSIGVPYKLDGTRTLLRMLARGGAVTAAFVGVMIWLIPGGSMESDVMLFKMGVTIGTVYAALAFWQASLPPSPPSVEIDTAKGELRLVRSEGNNQRRVIERCAFEDLQTAEISGRHIAFWAAEGRLLAEITLSNATAHATLLAVLRQAGKLD
ncbi:hypothetical protein ABMC88_14765 [Sulfitobacter sp. HNIBRBA2951]|uniref:hypothetical protein n=1 Tax=Sulfitobacter aquimarinus TaxID=3158557 RepID=UPI0032DF2253